MQHQDTGVYAIYDAKAADYVGPLQLHKADAVAIRTFGDLVADRQTYIGQHPADYRLDMLGHITANGLIAGPPITIIEGKAVRAAQEETNASA